MQAQGKLKEGETKRYKSTFSAFREIFKEGGIRALYTGVGPTVKRAAILTATQVTDFSYMYMKCKVQIHTLRKKKENKDQLFGYNNPDLAPL